MTAEEASKITEVNSYKQDKTALIHKDLDKCLETIKQAAIEGFNWCTLLPEFYETKEKLILLGYSVKPWASTYNLLNVTW